MKTQNTETMHRRVELEDALKAAIALQNAEAVWKSADLARLLEISDALGVTIAQALVASGWAEESGSGKMHLTETGRVRAVELIRAHRLWELYLVDREGKSLDVVHDDADQMEHEITPEQAKELDAQLGFPAWDPHGHTIPDSGSHVPLSAGQSLLEAAMPGSWLRVVELDDTQEGPLTQLVALGLEPGTEVKVIALAPDHLELQVGDKVVSLSCDAANHVLVVPSPACAVRMGELAVGSRAQVVELTGSGKLQRRMLSMGFVPGAEVTVVRQAPLGDPLQYRVKKANIALRRDEANTLLVREFGKG
jgi:Fe2+ transport system protein FeoA/Mn-dependent DtxR family transcriptional regulator